MVGNPHILCVCRPFGCEQIGVCCVHMLCYSHNAVQIQPAGDLLRNAAFLFLRVP